MAGVMRTWLSFRALKNRQKEKSMTEYPVANGKIYKASDRVTGLKVMYSIDGKGITSSAKCDDGIEIETLFKSIVPVDAG